MMQKPIKWPVQAFLFRTWYKLGALALKSEARDWGTIKQELPGCSPGGSFRREFLIGNTQSISQNNKEFYPIVVINFWKGGIIVIYSDPTQRRPCLLYTSRCV